MAEKLPEKTSKFGKYVVKPKPWIMELIMLNCDILPEACKPVLLDVAYKGYIEDEEKFGEMFEILQMIDTGMMIGEELTPEVYAIVKEGRRLKYKRDSEDYELQEFEATMRKWNREMFERATRREPPNRTIHKIPEEDERESY